MFGNHDLGQLLSRVHATVISSGTELEKIIIGKSVNIDDVDAFLGNQQLPHGTYIISKKAIKESSLSSDKEPDILIFRIAENVQHCYIIELKDGDTFDTKKAAGEVQNLVNFENHISRRIRFTTSIHICSFNQPDKEKIVAGFKKKITIEQAMTGSELCDLLGINYAEIIHSRLHEQNANIEYFVKCLIGIDIIRAMIIEKLQNNQAS
ncbi:MAG: type II restriction endonuclease [Bacteroidetes bacterium]|nr:type II restriction endonuclease [Bacteroidota bacterium]